VAARVTTTGRLSGDTHGSLLPSVVVSNLNALQPFVSLTPPVAPRCM
jgi:hypothetical protein